MARPRKTKPIPQQDDSSVPYLDDDQLALLGKLPKPPQRDQQTVGSLQMWLRRVADAGGWEGLKLVRQPEVWNWLVPVIPRMKLHGIEGQLMHEIDEASKRSRTAAAEQQADRAREAACAKIKAMGW